MEEEVVVVTGFCPNDLKLGQGFMETFDRFWPQDINIYVYIEEKTRLPHPKGRDRIFQRSLWDIPGMREFRDIKDLKYHGREPISGRWQKKDERVGYSYRFDAVRFSPQLFIPDHAAQQLPDGTIMVWLDADIVTYNEVPDGFVNRLMVDQGGEYDLITMGRTNSATELGFWACRLGPAIREMLRDMADCCRHHTIFNLPEWHSGYVFDHWVAHHRERIKHKSLTKGHGHIWFQCEIGLYTDHLKGEIRKRLGYSPERDGVALKQLRGI